MAVLAIYSGDGQIAIAGGIAPLPLRALYTTDGTTPIVGGTVTWAITSGNGQVSPASSITDTDGIAATRFFGNAAIVIANSWESSGIQASAAGAPSVSFAATTFPYSDNHYATGPTITVIEPQWFNVMGYAGQTIAGGVQLTATGFFGIMGTGPVPGIGVVVTSALNPLTEPTISGSGITNAGGVASVTVTLGAIAGGPVAATVTVAGTYTFPLVLTVRPLATAWAQNIDGNYQYALSGETFTNQITGRFTKSDGTRNAGAATSWNCPAGLTLVAPDAVTDANGEASTGILASGGDGWYRVSLTVSGLSVYWDLHTGYAAYSGTAPNAGGLTTTAGSNQSALSGTGFNSVLTTSLVDSTNAPVVGARVSFKVASGRATLSSAYAVTNEAGQASVTVKAGSPSGYIGVLASAQGYTSTFTLASLPATASASFIATKTAIEGIKHGGEINIYRDLNKDDMRSDQAPFRINQNFRLLAGELAKTQGITGEMRMGSGPYSFAGDVSFDRNTSVSGTVTLSNRRPLIMDSLPIYADNAEALANGQGSGDVYRTLAGVLMVVYGA